MIETHTQLDRTLERPMDQPVNRPADRPIMAVRWHIDSADTLRRGWPEPGTEHEQIAVGWVPFEGGFGVIEWSGEPVSERLLNTLEQHFPGRRWVSARDETSPAIDPAIDRARAA